VISECHELFGHPTYGAPAAKLAISVIKQGRKFGITLILDTQSPTAAAIPTDVTRNVSCGVAFSVGDHDANDGLLGSGRYRAGIRATELRMHTDRGTCVAVGVSDATFELINTFYVPYADGIDLVTPVVTRAMPPSTNCAAPVTPPPAMTTRTKPRRSTTWPISMRCCAGSAGYGPRWC
jgi:S-DNA-T family DNA segregation ATPase FtsK/SpoIIIE